MHVAKVFEPLAGYAFVIPCPGCQVNLVKSKYDKKINRNLLCMSAQQLKLELSEMDILDALELVITSLSLEQPIPLWGL
jgi:hypothetical protein